MFTDNTQVAKYNARAPFDDTAAPPLSKGIGDLLHQTKNCLKVVYDFGTMGGAIGTINLVDDLGRPALLPVGALIVKSEVDVVTPATSGGSATFALKIQSTADILAATAVASVTGSLDGKQDGTAANFIKLTAQHQVQAVIATAALTAGKVNIFLEYVISN